MMMKGMEYPMSPIMYPKNRGRNMAIRKVGSISWYFGMSTMLVAYSNSPTTTPLFCFVGTFLKRGSAFSESSSFLPRVSWNST